MEGDFSAIAERFGLALIVLFGSTVKGTAGPMSDVDVLIHAPRALSLEEEAALRAALADICHAPEDRIDVVALTRANPQLAFEALWRGKPVWGDIEALHTEQVRAWKRLQDDRTFIRRRRTFLDAFVSRAPIRV